MVSIEQLERIGLATNEAKVYLALLRLGSGKAGKVAKESEVERTSTYNALQGLLAKGLASYVTIGKVRWFQAAPPERLVEYFEARTDQARELMPALQGLYKQTTYRQNVKLFKGMRGVKSVLNDIIATKQENLLFGSEGQLEERMPVYAQRFVNELRRARIPVKSLIREDRATPTGDNASVRLVPKSVESPVVTNIYGEKIALIIWTEQPEAVLIENKAAADAYRSYFRFMWDHARKL